MMNKYNVGDRVYFYGKKCTVEEVSVESTGHVQYILKPDNGPISMVYESHQGLTAKKVSRIKPMYAFVKLNKALICLSAICQWGDSKHGVGPVKTDVDYKAKQQAHFVRMMAGEKLDQESGIDHRVAIAFNCLAELQVEMGIHEVEDLVTKDLNFFTKEYKK